MKNAPTKTMITVAIVGLMMVFASMVHSHCQIPCGIYDDQTRFTMMSEHVTTIEKSMKQIDSLSKAEKPYMNQIVRWVNNKEKHADALSEIITHYFMAQRVKPAAPTDKKAYQKYVNKLTLLHQMLFYSMKAKQSTEFAHVAKLRSLIAEFRTAYFDSSR